MAALDEICAELLRLSNDLSSPVLSHGEIDFYIYRLEQRWRVLFHIYYKYSEGNNAFDDGLVLQHIRHAILCLNECNRVLDLSYRCPVDQSGMAGRPRLTVTKDQLEYLIDNDFGAKDIANMLNISIRTVYRRFQDFGLSIRAYYSFISDVDLDAVIREIIREFPNIGYRRVHGELSRRKIKVTQHRVQGEMHRVDPSGVAVRWMNSIPRRTYNVNEPLALWHIDGNHKLIR